MESKCIAVTGNIGKTIFSFYFAQLLSVTKKRVALVSTDDRYPIYSTLFPQKRKNEKGLKSLGKLLSLPLISQADVFSHGHIVNDNLLMLSYDEHESNLNYPEIGETAVNSLLSELRKIADVVLVDTSSYKNKIDSCMVVPETPKITITSADAKGFYYRDLHQPGRWNLYLQTSKYNALQDVEASYTKTDNATLLPFSKNLQSIYNGLDITDIAPNSQYGKVLLKIAGEI